MMIVDCCAVSLSSFFVYYFSILFRFEGCCNPFAFLPQWNIKEFTYLLTCYTIIIIINDNLNMPLLSLLFLSSQSDYKLQIYEMIIPIFILIITEFIDSKLSKNDYVNWKS